jgi:hypothetical protein
MNLEIYKAALTTVAIAIMVGWTIWRFEHPKRPDVDRASAETARLDEGGYVVLSVNGLVVGKIYEDGRSEFPSFHSSVALLVRNLMQIKGDTPTFQLVFKGTPVVLLSPRGILYGSQFQASPETRRFFDAVFTALMAARDAAGVPLSPDLPHSTLN